MYLVVIAWLYVALMMAVAEATHSAGTVLGAFFTFVLYGAVPVALVIYLGGRPARRRAAKAREAAQLEQQRAASAAPDGSGEAAAEAPVAPVRKEP
ncbi:hypothetical protein RAMLITH_04195 [Ramlibacter sp. RBP-2]|uniref:Transmembrane protein n=1 Tax=Ramlibacter lithotrophicus TaxID=2606681 RepID=A0A7X6DD87_9BURK|nr:hypothetical protein [Ramlibacter lithotrophicus]NKE65011.1 hypothetical protein [Ramlibacter lithotrophicus]